MNISDDRSTPFVWLHLEALDRLRFYPPSVDRVYLHLIRRAGHHGQCWESIESMAAACSLSPGTLKRSLSILYRMGMIVRTGKADGRLGKTSLYSITSPESWIDGSKMTQVKNEPRSNMIQGGGSNMTHGGGSNMTHKLDPIELDPIELRDQERDLDRACVENEILVEPVQIEQIVRTEESQSTFVQQPNSLPPSSGASPLDLQAWLEVFNQYAPSRWTRLSISFLMAPNTIMAIRGYCAGYEDSSTALEYFKGALAYLRVCQDSWYRDRALQPSFIFNPDKLPLSQFFRVAEGQGVNAQAIFESGLDDDQIQAERSKLLMSEVSLVRAQRLEEVNRYRRSIGAPELLSL